MKNSMIRKTPLHETGQIDNSRGKSPQECIGMMWQLALDAWSFKENIDAEPRLQRHVVELKRGSG